MFTVIVLTCGALTMGLLVDEAAAKELGIVVRRAMHNADLTQDFVARCIGVPPPKLSDQLSGKAPFTTFWRFFIAKELRASDFRDEFIEELSRTIDRVLMPRGVRVIFAEVDPAGKKKRMAKAALPVTDARQKEAV